MRLLIKTFDGRLLNAFQIMPSADEVGLSATTVEVRITDSIKRQSCTNCWETFIRQSTPTILVED